MITLPIINAVICPWSDQFHSIALCEQLCDHATCIEHNTIYCTYNFSTLLIQPTVMCPVVNKLMSVGGCADQCNCYECDDGSEMLCNYNEVL